MVFLRSFDLATRARLLMHRLDVATTRRPAVLVCLGLALTLWIAGASMPPGQWSPESVRGELTRKEDIHNLYFAARAATWRDVPRWWVGSWIYPDVDYYRPITSMLYFAEQKLFDKNFTAYDWVTWTLHIVNAALLYLLTISLLDRHPRARVLLGLVAVYYFATAANSMYFGVFKALAWWPAQNDVLSLTFALLCLLLLDQHLKRPRVWVLCLSLLALVASVGSKEMGFITAPIALALIFHRKRRFTLDAAAFLLVTTSLWILRRVCVPHAWAPVMFRWWIVIKGLHHWGGPLADLAFARVWWVVAAAAAVTVITGAGLRKRIPVLWIAVGDLIAACLCAQFVAEEGSWAAVFVDSSLQSLISALLYILGAALFWRYRSIEPGILTGGAMLLAFLPILQYGGMHYFYWPGAFLAMADAVFVACLWRWARELRDTANWSVPRLNLGAAVNSHSEDSGRTGIGRAAGNLSSNTHGHDESGGSAAPEPTVSKSTLP